MLLCWKPYSRGILHRPRHDSISSAFQGTEQGRVQDFSREGQNSTHAGKILVLGNSRAKSAYNFLAPLWKKYGMGNRHENIDDRIGNRARFFKVIFLYFKCVFRLFWQLYSWKVGPLGPSLRAPRGAEGHGPPGLNDIAEFKESRRDSPAGLQGHVHHSKTHR